MTVPVTNIGKRAGVEVVQVYVRKVNDIEGPLKTLRGYKRVEIPAGKTEQVTIELNLSSFDFFDSQRKMMVTPGEYDVFYGNSSSPKDLKKLSVNVLIANAPY